MIVLNSGRPVPNETMAREQQVTCDALLNEIRTRSEAEQLVDSLWLVGSLGRGDKDPLSDIDLVLTAAKGSTEELVDRLPTLAAEIAPVALTHDAPENAPADGAQSSVLYDVSPLPVYVDWSVWPRQPRRPADGRVLLERDPTQFETNGSFDEIVSALPKGNRSEVTCGYLERFRIFMIPIVAKDAARGWTASVEIMMNYMQTEDRPVGSLAATIAQLRQILADHAGVESAAATSCVTRFLNQLERLMTTEDRAPGGSDRS